MKEYKKSEIKKSAAVSEHKKDAQPAADFILRNNEHVAYKKLNTAIITMRYMLMRLGAVPPDVDWGTIESKSESDCHVKNT